jgi:protein-S-isoprenylcysteine O-methyltransferase Ste14
MLEKYMRAKYGRQWAAYERATPHRLLPGVW